jgi:NADPH-dependent 2,4-dienoyl-CoA reductase/sulfur reductase-like enzyme/rhodanese-related sulfurtransferase
MKLVVIGGVAAGLKAASKARRTDPSAEITVVEKGSLISYGACGLPYYVGAEVNSLDELMKTPAGMLRNPEYFRDVKNIKVLTRTLATGIDRKAKNVPVRNLDTGAEYLIPYDKLVIATGASPIKPNIPGMELQNIFSLWHPDDAKAMRQGLEHGKFGSAAVIGAGLVGMEMVEALKTWGCDITLIEMKDQVFPAFLDAEIAGLVEKYLRENDIRLLTGEKVLKFSGDEAVTAVETDKGTVAADLVIMALGVCPNVELAASAGLEIGPTGAIAVSPLLQTSDPDIFAGGDCVENINIVSGRKVFAPMGSTANKHGRIIGENLYSGRDRFKGILNTVIVKVLDLNAGKTGITEIEAKELGYDHISVTTAGFDKPHYMEGAKLITIKLLAETKSRKILGVQALGEGDVAKRIDVVASVLTLGGTIDDLFDIDLSYAPPYSSPIDSIAVAANALMNKLAGRFNGISSIAAKELLKDEKVVFLDVRTPAEFGKTRLARTGKIRHIPLSELRRRCSELNRDDQIVAYCKVSLRGFEAEGILEGENFRNVKVIEGGLFSWPFEIANGPFEPDKERGG